jgi:hypothetical protein
MPAAGLLVHAVVMAGVRDLDQRKQNAIEQLTTANADVWVASASPAGVVHLVPLSFFWDGVHVIVSIEASSVTAANLASTRRARLAVGPTRDVVMIDATVVETIPLPEAPSEISDGYAAQADWDPRLAGGDYIYVKLRPDRVQVWRESNEIAGRTLMRDGTWIV